MNERKVAIEEAIEEIERLNKENELLKSNPNFVYAMRNNKAIEYIDKLVEDDGDFIGQISKYRKKELLEILKGEDKE